MKKFYNFLPAVILSSILLSSSAFATDWKLAPSEGTLGFSGTQVGKEFNGEFKDYTGVISFDAAHPESGHADITINMQSAVTNDKQRDEALPSKDWFDIKTFPSSSFKIKSFKPKGKDTYDADGELTIRGITKAVTLPLEMTVNGSSLHLKGETKLVRTVFNVGTGAWSSAQWVGLDVDVKVDVTAHN